MDFVGPDLIFLTRARAWGDRSPWRSLRHFLKRLAVLVFSGEDRRVSYTYVVQYHELEIEPIQAHMAQKPVLWVEVGARVLIRAIYKHREKDEDRRVSYT